ncbi:MAG: hypothetical protein LC733_01030, partial [Actinobacteria bacterium]|nr:hypothetical protein [Actinomycetota bacterium]
PLAFSGPVTTSGLHLDLTLLNLLGIPVGATLDIPATTTINPGIDGPSQDKFWSFPAQFPPPDGTQTTQHAGSQPVGLQSLTNITLGTPVWGGLGAPLLNLVLRTNIINSLLPSLGPLLGSVDNQVVTPLVSALGLDVGSADVTALSMTCGVPGLLQ